MEQIDAKVALKSHGLLPKILSAEIHEHIISHLVFDEVEFFDDISLWNGPHDPILILRGICARVQHRSPQEQMQIKHKRKFILHEERVSVARPVCW